MTYRHVYVISRRGTAPEQFAESLRGLAVDRQGLLYAAGDREVKVFDHQGNLRRRWATAGPGSCVSVEDYSAAATAAARGSTVLNAPDAVVYVGESGQIEQFDARGKLLRTWQDANRLAAVTAIGFYKEYILVADARDRCIRRYDRQGQWLNDIGKDNNTRGFLIPNGHLDFGVDAAGLIHVANPGKHRVERYSLTGELLGYFGKFGMQRPEDFPGCCNPTNLALTTKGHIVVTEKAPPRMKVYDPDGTLLALVGPEAFDPNCKNMDVAVDLQDRIYVADTVRLHICVFAPEADTGTAATGPAGGTGEAKP